jgi:hypothetical protein
MIVTGKMSPEVLALLATVTVASEPAAVQQQLNILTLSLSLKSSTDAEVLAQQLPP